MPVSSHPNPKQQDAHTRAAMGRRQHSVAPQAGSKESTISCTMPLLTSDFSPLDIPASYVDVGASHDASQQMMQANQGTAAAAG